MQTRFPSRPLAVSVAAPSRSILLGLLGAVLFAALTLLGAHIRIPLQPVPITMQTLFVLLAGAVLGGRFGALSQSLYVGLGVLGLPIFAGSVAGLAVLAGPTGGYLIGFALAPLWVGTTISRARTFAAQALVFFSGSVIILGLGVAHLTLFYTHDVMEALRLGYFPFIPGDILKILAATSIYRSYRRIRPTNAGR